MPMTMIPCPATSMNSAASLRAALKRLPLAARLKLLATADKRFLEFFDKDVELFAHDFQLPPATANDGGAWTIWLFLGGRGAGKTWAGARFVRGLAFGLPPFAGRAHRARRRNRA